MSIFRRPREWPRANYVLPAAADAFPDEEYWASMHPTGLLHREIPEAYLLGVALRKQTPAQFEPPPITGSQWP